MGGRPPSKTRTSARSAGSGAAHRKTVADYERRLRLLDGRMRILERERQKLSAVVHHTDAGFLAFDPSLKVLWANNAFASRFWLEGKPGTFLGQPCHRVLCDRPASCAECPAERSFKEGAVAHSEMRLEMGGRTRHLYTTAMPISTMAGCVEETIVMLQDVSDLQVLRQSEARKGAILDTALDAILTIDGQGRITEFNQAAERMFGWTREEVAGREMGELILPPGQRETYRQALERCLRAGATHAVNRMVEMTAMCRDGTEFPVELALTRIPLDGDPMFTGYIRDISERRTAEEALRSSEEQLRQAQKMEAVGRLAGGVAHDFNNLLTVIRGRCELLGTRIGDVEKMKRDIGTIYDASERAASLTHQLLAFSRRQVLEPKVLELNRVVADLVPMLRRLIGEDIDLGMVLATDIGRVRADPGQVEQVIMNLVVNARDAMPEGGRLTIETSAIDFDETYARVHASVKPGRYVMVAVSDTGSGMDRETQARAFEPFFTTKERGKGTGLGLATAYGIVKQSGGYIWVYSEPGQGTTFKIYLPRVEEAATAEAPPAASSRAPRGSETVLLTEDEDIVRTLAREILESHGYTILEARRGSEALQVCERFEGEIHLLLTDVVMPRMSGRDLAIEVTALRPGVKVLYMSGYTEDAIGYHGVLDPGLTYLQKPFTLASLTQKVREALDRPAAAPDLAAIAG